MKTYLPNLPLVGEEGKWENIANLIEQQMLPRIEASGTNLFTPQLRLIPEGASVVPILHPHWSRPRQDPVSQLVYLVTGHGQMLVGDRWLALSTGQGIFLPKGTLYAPHVMVNGIPSCDWLWFKVHPFGVAVHRCRLKPTAHYQSVTYFIADRRLADLFGEWEENHTQLNPLVGKGLLVAFFGLLARSMPLPSQMPQTVVKDTDSLPLPVRQALTVIHRAYNKTLRLGQLARYCGVTPAYLCRLFRRSLGIAPCQYLDRLRLDVAYQLLRGTGLSVADIAFLVGYNDLRHFRRVFRRTYGFSPGEIRETPKRHRRFLRTW